MPKRRTILLFLLLLLFLFVVFWAITYPFAQRLLNIYRLQKSVIVKDRDGTEVAILPNQRGYWARYLDKIPPRFKKLLVEKEDKYFYYHPGFNPISIIEAILGRVGLGKRKASSTITQQLVKVLLGTETKRNIKNKLVELFYALALEAHLSKEEILKMYANSIYFGNQAQGIGEASRLYFGKDPNLLEEGQILQLLSAISNPQEQSPEKYKNRKVALSIGKRLGLNPKNLELESPKEVRANMEKYSHLSPCYFELKDFIKKPSKDITFTIDCALTERIREILRDNIYSFRGKKVHNGAVIVIKLPENEILALVGSPDPSLSYDGYKINMLKKPRAIGSTIKPFIYLKAFEKGLRPYTLVEDREYKYITALGFPLYPKNYDFKYRGIVNLHYALANSLNVPAVKVLEFVGLDNFYQFLEKDLGFRPVQDLKNYQLGISLGALEMPLFDLAKYFTIFPNNGVLRNLKILKDTNQNSEKQISRPEYIQLINKILNDRKTGIEQFGLVSDLNLPQKNYALKTGTSRDFRDSWVIGYTPDFLVGVWMGNADNSPMDKVSGQLGAGRVWSEVMELLFNSKYNKNTPFKFDLIKAFQDPDNGGIDFGLEGDDYRKIKNILLKKDNSIILKPHSGDSFILEEGSEILLEAREKVKWFIDEDFIGQGKIETFSPKKPGVYQITAVSEKGKKETIKIWLIND